MMQLTDTFFADTTLDTHFALLTNKFFNKLLPFSTFGNTAMSKSPLSFSRIPDRTVVTRSLVTTSSAFVILCLDGKFYTLNWQGSHFVSSKIPTKWQGLFAFCNPTFRCFKSFDTFSFDEM